MLPTFNHPTKVRGSIEMKLKLDFRSGKPTIVGTYNSTDKSGWITIDSSSKQLRIPQNVILSYTIGVEMQKL